MWARGDETHFLFSVPHVLTTGCCDTLIDAVNAIYVQLAAWDEEIQTAEERIETIISDAYKLTDSEKQELVTRTPNRPVDKTAYDAAIDSVERAGASLSVELISYCIGCAFGRWDVRIVGGTEVDFPEPFGSLPNTL